MIKDIEGKSPDKSVKDLLSDNNDRMDNSSFKNIAEVMKTSKPTTVYLLGDDVDFSGYISPTLKSRIICIMGITP